ncbi:ATP-binding cassette subfamily B protein [Kitasatospora sp. MAA19]|uniref:peptidase domain-containing ABC transporter n=1 Tax=unclassified Kitasatospora TaxID=2633591 RepID=UPI002472EBEB|nr:peptidase domain-containing ABC transporter [Kitasatospora sp. MAA19]MDH6708432.1 ATP-binding cassette subfamily B protein [Kitasatospora sp. MAA19]
MTGESRFRPEALEHHRRRDGLGPVLGHPPAAPRPVGFAERMAAVRERLPGRSAARRLSVCFQTQVSDCGPAALVTVLRHHGIDVSLDAVRARADSGRNGASARTLLEIAREYGVKGRGVRADLDALRRLRPGAILFWNFNHFVVLEGAGKEYVDVVDPAYGRRRLSRASVAESFTGVALEFEPPLDGTTAATRGTETGSPWRRLRQFLPGRRELVLLLAASAGLMAFELALPLTAGILVERVVPDGSTATLWGAGALLAGLGVLFFLLQLARSVLVAKRQAVIEKRLTLGIVSHMADLPYDFFTVRNSGDLAMRARASNVLIQVLSVTAVSAVLDSVLVVAYLIAIVLTNPPMAALVAALVAVQAGLLVITWRRQTELSQEVLERQTKAQEELVEMLESISSLKSSGLEGRAAERWSHTLVHEVNKRLGARRNLALFSSLSRTVQFGAPLAVLLVGIWLVLTGRDSLGEAMGFMTLTIALFIPLEGMFDAGSQLAAVRPTLARLDDVLRAAPEPRGALVGAGVAEPGRIAASGVSFRYPGAPRPTLSDVELDVQPGQFVAIVGRSGSGKSTLGMLLAGLYVPTGGTITVDGMSLGELDRPTYRRRIGYVNQNAHLFGGSIRDNILLGSEDISEADLKRAVQLAHIHGEIKVMPMGYDTLVAPGGHGMSGGQRQRIVLARALAKQPKLVILDEATSALDPALEEAIMRDLLAAGITVVVIAHRLTVLDDADQVIVMRDGRIVEAGPPAALKESGEEYLCLT